eukprot:7682929-Pyramimonas_sp.AAC.1
MPLWPLVELLWGHGTLEGYEYACEPCHWNLRGISLLGRATYEAFARMSPSTHANRTIGASGGAPYGAMN